MTLMTIVTRRLLAAALSIMLLTTAVAGAESVDGKFFREALGYTVQVRVAQAVADAAGVKAGQGAGFVVDKARGWVLTNAHVASRYPSKVEVAFKDRGYVRARKVYVDPAIDVAILSVGDEVVIAKATEAPLACNSEVEVGHPVGALGHPLGFPYTGTRGIVSGQGAKTLSLMQTDVPMSPGSSGGPVISLMDGQVVGISTAGMESFPNSNFALRVTFACRIVELLKAGRDPSPPRLPYSFYRDPEGRGVVRIAQSFARPGELPLLPGDEIVGVVGTAHPIRNPPDLTHALRGRLDSAQVRVKREEQELVVSGRLTSEPLVTEIRRISAAGVIFAEREPLYTRLDGGLGPIVAEHIEDGAVGLFTGLKPREDYLHSVDGRPVESMDALYARMNAASKEGRKVRLVFGSNECDRPWRDFLEVEAEVKEVRHLGTEWPD